MFIYVVEEEKVKAELVLAPPNEEGVIEKLEDKLSIKARLGLQAKSAIQNNSNVCEFSLNHYMFILHILIYLCKIKDILIL